MPETLKLSSSNLKSWLEGETSLTFVSVHSQAERFFHEINKVLNELAKAAETLIDSSAKEIEKRNVKTYKRAKALNKLSRLFLERIRQIEIPEKVLYERMDSFVQEVQKVLIVTEIDAKNWFPRISPFFILDRRKFLTALENAKTSLKEVQKFMTKEYAKTKSLEETFQLIDKVQSLEAELSNLRVQKLTLENEREKILKEIADINQKMADIRREGEINKLSEVNLEINELNSEVEHALKHLQKPFIKLHATSLRDGGNGLTQDEHKKLTHYVNNPFEALAEESEGYPILKQLLRKLNTFMANGKLTLKPDKMRKAEQTIRNVLWQDSLRGIHKKCVDALYRKKNILTSMKLVESQRELSKLQTVFENLEMKKNSLEAEEKLLETAAKEKVDKIQNCNDKIVKNIFSVLGKRIVVEKVEA